MKPPVWQERENALMWGAPLAIVPALTIVPITVSLFLYPVFPWARAAGVLLTISMGCSVVIGLSRLSVTLRRDFDALTFFAAGVVLTMWAIVTCSGVLLGIVLTN